MIPKILQELETLKEENEHLRNRSVRLTLIFRGKPELEKSDAWEDAPKSLVNLLAHKLDLDHYELDLQLGRANYTPESNFDKGYCIVLYYNLFIVKKMYE